MNNIWQAKTLDERIALFREYWFTLRTHVTSDRGWFRSWNVQMKRRRLAVLIAATTTSLGLLTWTRHSPAQNAVSAAAYEDVKEIIEELISKSVAELTARIACYSQNGLMKHYPRSLQAFYERNFSGAMKGPKAETAGLVSSGKETQP